MSEAKNASDRVASLAAELEAEGFDDQRAGDEVILSPKKPGSLIEKACELHGLSPETLAKVDTARHEAVAAGVQVIGKLGVDIMAGDKTVSTVSGSIPLGVEKRAPIFNVRVPRETTRIMQFGPDKGKEVKTHGAPRVSVTHDHGSRGGEIGKAVDAVKALGNSKLSS